MLRKNLEWYLLVLVVCVRRRESQTSKRTQVYATAKAALIETLRTKHRITIDKALEWGSIEIAEFNEKGKLGGILVLFLKQFDNK